MTTTVTFKDCLNTVRELPFGSATDEAIRWMKGYGVTDLSVIDKSQDKFGMNFSKENIKQTLVRICVAATLPLIATVGIGYNLAAGTTRFATGCLGHLKKADREELKTEFNAAFTHLATAIYDFAVGYFLGMNQIGLLIAATGFGLFPSYAFNGHDFFFAKAEKTETEAQPIPDAEKNKTEKQPSSDTEKSKTEEQPVLDTEKSKVKTSDHFALKGCLVNKLAGRLAEAAIPAQADKPWGERVRELFLGQPTLNNPK